MRFRKWFWTLVLLVLLCSCNAFAGKRVRVMIDPGHGGEDEGASHFKLKEKTIALNVGLELKALLANDPRFDVILTREKDVFIPLDDRTKQAKMVNPDVFISIHLNSSPSLHANGTEFYFENQIATDEESLFLANRENYIKDAKSDRAPAKASDLSNILTDLAHNEHIMMSEILSQSLLDAFRKEMGSKPRAIRQAPFRVLGVPMPASLVELGFLSNVNEASWLNKQENQRRMALSIYRGIERFKEKLDKIHRRPIK